MTQYGCRRGTRCKDGRRGGACCKRMSKRYLLPRWSWKMYSLQRTVVEEVLAAKTALEHVLAAKTDVERTRCRDGRKRRRSARCLEDVLAAKAAVEEMRAVTTVVEEVLAAKMVVEEVLAARNGRRRGTCCKDGRRRGTLRLISTMSNLPFPFRPRHCRNSMVAGGRSAVSPTTCRYKISGPRLIKIQARVHGTRKNRVRATAVRETLQTNHKTWNVGHDKRY